MIFWVLNIVFLLIILFLLFLLSWFWPPDSPWSFWWRTNKKMARKMCKLANVSKKDIIYDLGCGDGTALLVASKEFNAKGVGIEIDPLRYFISKIRMRINNQKNIKIIKKNFYDVDLSNASVIFVYLVPRVLKKLRPKFAKELKKGTRIVSFVYEMDFPLKAIDRKNKIMVYEV